MDNFGNPPSIENIERDAIRKLEEFTDIGFQGKEQVLATYMDLKPLSDVDITCPTEDLENKTNELSEILKSLKLNSMRTNQDVDNFPKVGRTQRFFLVSKNSALMKEYHGYTSQNKREKDNQIIFDRTTGSLLGFPPTAVEGFATGNFFKEEEEILPKEISEEEKKFLFFRLSRDRWKEEIVWLRRIIDGIRDISPIIYYQIMTQNEIKDHVK